MKSIAIIYHSRQGHTQFIAQQIQIGAAKIEDMNIDLFTAEQLMFQPESPTQYNGLIFGTPTYLGGVSRTLKQFMDATGSLWKKQLFKGKLTAGFTVSSLPAGDKQSTLISLFVWNTA